VVCTSNVLTEGRERMCVLGGFQVVPGWIQQAPSFQLTRSKPCRTCCSGGLAPWCSPPLSTQSRLSSSCSRWNSCSKSSSSSSGSSGSKHSHGLSNRFVQTPKSEEQHSGFPVHWSCLPCRRLTAWGASWYLQLQELPPEPSAFKLHLPFDLLAPSVFPVFHKVGFCICCLMTFVFPVVSQRLSQWHCTVLGATKLLVSSRGAAMLFTIKHPGRSHFHPRAHRRLCSLETAVFLLVTFLRVQLLWARPHTPLVQHPAEPN